MSLTRQEMFDLAVIGLRKQAYAKAETEGRCAYLTADGLRCAWGHVDTSLGLTVWGGVSRLRQKGVGLAAQLSEENVKWVIELQAAHDDSNSPTNMKERMTALGRKFGLSWPRERCSLAPKAGSRVSTPRTVQANKRLDFALKLVQYTCLASNKPSLRGALVLD